MSLFLLFCWCRQQNDACVESIKGLRWTWTSIADHISCCKCKVTLFHLHNFLCTKADMLQFFEANYALVLADFILFFIVFIYCLLGLIQVCLSFSIFKLTNTPKKWVFKPKRTLEQHHRSLKVLLKVVKVNEKAIWLNQKAELSFVWINYVAQWVHNLIKWRSLAGGQL